MRSSATHPRQRRSIVGNTRADGAKFAGNRTRRPHCLWKVRSTNSLPSTIGAIRRGPAGGRSSITWRIRPGGFVGARAHQSKVARHRSTAPTSLAFFHERPIRCLSRMDRRFRYFPDASLDERFPRIAGQKVRSVGNYTRNSSRLGARQRSSILIQRWRRCGTAGKCASWPWH